MSAAGLQCFDEAGCRQSMIDRRLARPSNAERPEGAILLSSILRVRKPDGKVSGIMPIEPADYIYPQACVDRIAAWIKNGVPAD
ncbi:MAG: hypothetical protein KIT84_34060 [Labilithrix sp.]|nr:hypothetical protein [Labilithrix sp.]MCW5816073.1 hypothetical protein [Labilithrix sp.]